MLRDPVPASLAASRKLSSEGNDLMEQKQPEKAEENFWPRPSRSAPRTAMRGATMPKSLWLRNAGPRPWRQLEEACRLNPGLRSAGPPGGDVLGNGPLRRRLALRRSGVEEEPPAGCGVAAFAEGRSGPSVISFLAAGNRDQASAAYVQALNDLHRAAGYDPSDRQAIGETAAVYRSLGQPQRALESMQALAETYSPGEEPQQVLYLTGLDYMALQRYDDAAASLSAALNRGRPAPELLYCLAQAQYRGGHSQEAAEALQRALVIDPQHLLSRQLLGQIEVARQGAPSAWR